MRLKFVYTLYFIFVIKFAFSIPLDSLNNDSLKKILPSLSKEEKIEAYFILGERYIDINNDSAEFFFKKTISLAKNLKQDTTVFTIYSIILELKDNEQQAKQIFNNLLQISKKLNNDSLIGQAYLLMADWYKNHNFNIEAIDFYKKSLSYITNKQKLGEIYNNLGVVSKRIGNLDSALVYYIKALNLIEKYDTDPYHIILIMNNIALVHKQQSNYDISIEYFYKILKKTNEIKEEKLKTDIQARTYLNIALVLNLMERHQEALENILIAKKLFKKINSKYIVYAYRNIGQTYIELKKLDLAIANLDSALFIAGNNARLIGNLYYLKAKAELEKAEQTNNPTYYIQAITLSNKALEYLKKTNSTYLQNKVYAILYKSHSKLGNYKAAFENALSYIKTNQILFNQEKTKVIQEMEAKYQAEKKQQEIEKQKLVIEKQSIEVKRQKMQRNGLIAIVILMAAFIYVVFRSYQQKKRDNLIIQQKNQELEQAYEEIRVQRDQLQEQKDKIQYLLTQLQDSIHYAERIQFAAMPTHETLKQWFDEYFIFFRPRDIVSGDFYWAKLIQGRYLAFTVADCTGHGVPGAFVSMLGISLLNEITQRRDINSAAQVLEEMRKSIKESLKQSQDFGDSKDGMDIAFCMYDKQTHILQFAGANNPLYFIRKGELTVYPAVKNPVAIYIREKKFETYQIKIENGDIIYLSSDGYYDQPGGPKGKKFMRKNFKELLMSIWDKPMKEQEKTIEMRFDDWKNGYKQLDDVCVMGVKFLF